MANKSPFKFIKVVFVAGPKGDQHIFQIVAAGRVPLSFCRMSGQDIHQDENGYANVTEYQVRIPDRPVCAKCEKGWKKHPQSPWKHWAGQKGKHWAGKKA